MNGPPRPEDTTSILKDIGAGHPFARELLFTRLRPRLVALVRKLLPSFDRVSAEEIEDLVQDLCIDLTKQFNNKNIPKDSDNFFRLSAVIIRHLLIDRAKKERRRGPVARLSPGLVDSESAIVHDPANDTPGPACWAQIEEFFEAVGNLATVERQIVECRLLEEMSFKAIAERLAMNQKTVQRTWYKSCRALGPILPDHFGKHA